MPTQDQTGIYIPALIEDSYTTLKEFQLEGDVQYKTNKKGAPLSAAEYYNTIQLPTLAELMHAYFSRNHDDLYLSPEYRKNVHSNVGHGEWTSTFLENGNTVVERPNELICENNIWKAKGGKRTAVELPDNGWILEYDKKTGFPVNTCSNQNDAKKMFGDDASYFWRSDNNLMPVMRFSYHPYHNFTWFWVYVDFDPGVSFLTVGGRGCRIPTKKAIAHQKQ